MITRRTYFLALFALVVVFASIPHHVAKADTQAGAVDSTFVSGVGPNSDVRSIAVQSDRKIIIGGFFTTYNNAKRNRIARLSSDGSLDSSFNVGSGASGDVHSIAIQSDGKIIIGGSFTTYNGVVINRIARLNSDGSLDSSFNVGSGANGIVYSIAVQNDGKIIIGGSFTTYNGVVINRITRLSSDGSLDSSFNIGSGANGIVYGLAIQNNGKISIVGNFGLYNGAARSRIARLNVDGSLDSSFDVGSGANWDIQSVALQSDNKPVIVGAFTSYNGVARNRVARLNVDGSLDSSFNIGSGADSIMQNVAIQGDGKIVIGGYFNSYNAIVSSRVVRLNSDGSVDTSFNLATSANGVVYSVITQSDNKILIGGNFTAYNSIGSSRMALLNSDGSVVASFNVGSGASNSVLTLRLQNDGKVIIGGSFTTYNGISRSRIARLNSDGSLDSSFNVGTGADGDVQTIAIQNDGKVLIGGSFGSYNGTSRNRIARLNSDGSLDTSFNVGTGANGTILSVVVQSDGKVLIGGYFITYNGVGINRIARLNSDGSLDTGFNVGSGFNNYVSRISIQADSKIIIAGGFTSYNGAARNRIARLNSDGSLDSSFNIGTGANGSVSDMTIQSDGKTVILGSFSSYNGTPRNQLIRLNSNGSLDTSFDIGAGVDFPANSVAVQSDGKIIIGGSFTTYNGMSSNQVARLNSDGSLDTSFNVGSGPNGLMVTSLAIQSDGKIVIGGQFTSVDSYTRDYVARLEGVAKTMSNLALVSSPNASQIGQSVIFTATVTPITATGTVQFTFGTAPGITSVTSLLTDGMATYVTNTLPLGNTPLRANYSGDANLETSVSNVYTQTVTKEATSISVTSSPNPSIFGGTTTFSAIISPAQATGTVTFTIGAVQVSTPVASGVATYVTNTLASGSYPVSAIYDGSPTYSSSVSSNPYTHVVRPAVPGFIQWQNSSYSIDEAGGSAIFIATRTGGTDGVISATVVITNGTATNADYALPTPASLVVSWANGESGSKLFVLPIINDEFYEGDESLTVGLTNSTNGAILGSPATATLTILDNDLPLTELQLVATPNPSHYGQSVNITARVSVVAPGSGTPGGTVTFFADGNNLATISLVGLEASYTTSLLAVGSHTVTATYNGSPNYMPSKTFLNHLVEKAITDVSLVSSASSVVFGTSLTFTATLTPQAASGLVTFTFNGSEQTSQTRPVVNGVATYVTNTLVVGTYTVTATYGGDDSYTTSTSQPYTQLVTSTCSPQVVTNATDNGLATTCGTFSFALAQTTSGTISFALAGEGNTITFTGSLTHLLKAGIAIDGGANGIVLNGNGVAGDGLRLSRGNTLTNLTIKSFGGQELMASVSSADNHLFRVKVQS